MGEVIFLLIFLVGIPVAVTWFVIHRVRIILRRQRLQAQASQVIIDTAAKRERDGGAG
jgi:hypothetical protein